MAPPVSTTLQLHRYHNSEQFYKTLAEKAKTQKSWIPLPVDFHRHIYAFLPFESVVEIPTLNTVSAVQALQKRTVVRELLCRSSLDYPLYGAKYLFCKRFGEEMGIRHLRLSNFHTLRFDDNKVFSQEHSWKNVLIIVNELKDSLQSLDMPNMPNKSLRAFDEFDLEKEFPILSKLTHLDLSKCGSMQNEQIKCLVSKCPMLTHLILPYDITDEGLKALGSHCNKLLYLSLKICTNITNKGFVDIVPYCGNLTHLFVPRHITEESLADIAPFCGNLRYLDLIGCYQITVAGLKKILSYCPHLKHLNLYLSGIKQEDLTPIAPDYTNLRDLDLSSFFCGNEGLIDISSFHL